MRSARFLPVAIAGVFVLMAAVVIGFTFADSGGEHAANAPLEGRITVRGVGIIEVEPDQAILRFSARGRGETASAAMEEQARKSVLLNEVLKAYGIPERDIQTQRLSLSEETEYRNNTWVRIGYIASQTVQVIINDLSRVGEIIDALVEEAGIESIQSIDFQRRDRSAAAEAALRAAYQQAEARARIIAEAAGLEIIGPAVIYDETSDTGAVSVPMPEAAMLAAREASVTTQIQGGVITVEARVRVEFLYRKSEGVTLTTDKQQYRAGDPVVLTLRNNGNATLSYNLCGSSVEKYVDGVWVRVDTGRICTLELRILPPGGVDHFTFHDVTGLGPGTYRFATSVEVSGAGMTTLYSRSFVVL